MGRHKIKPQRTTLTCKECEVLNLVARKTKMDCWAWFIFDEVDGSYCYDLEAGLPISADVAIEQMSEGIDDKELYDQLNLSEDEARTLNELLYKHGIELLCLQEAV